MKSISFIAVLLALCTLLFFFRLGDRDFTSSHEARAAQNAQSILNNNCWLLPQLFNRQVELQKPPFYYWLVAWLAAVVGAPVNGWSVRLPAALSATATVLVVYFFCAWRGRRLAGFLAAVMLATCLHFTWLGRVGRIDMPLTLTTTLTVICFFTARAGGFIPPGQARRLASAAPTNCIWLFAGYTLLGIGFLLKGPIALALPIAVAVAAWLRTIVGRIFNPSPTNPSHMFKNSLRRLHQYGLWWGLPLAASIALPWTIAVNQITRGDFIEMFFWHHNFARGFGGAEELASYPFWYYLPRFAIDLLPWSVFFVPALWIFFRTKIAGTDGLAWLGLGWLTGMFVLLSCMSFKRADYLLPAYPGAALFLGCIFERWWLSASFGVRRFRFAPAVWLALVCACAIGWTIFTQVASADHSRLSQLRRLAEEIRSQDAGPVILFRTEAHDLAYRIGPPLVSFVEWQNLDAWAAKRRPVFVVMPRGEALLAPKNLRGGRLIEIGRLGDQTNSCDSRSLVLNVMHKKGDRPTGRRRR